MPNAAPRSGIDAMRGDPLLGRMVRAGGGPIRAAAIYGLVTLGGMVLLAWLSGTALPDSGTARLELFEDYENLINIGLVVPTGIVLIVAYYRRLGSGIARLVDDGILRFADDRARDEFEGRVNARLNVRAYVVAAAALAVGLNIWIGLHLEGRWNAIGEGAAAWWFRVVAIINFYAVFLFLIRGVASVFVLRGVMAQDVRVQPLHPDRCGGLLVFGRICGAMNLVIALFTFYMGVLVIFDGVPALDPAWLAAVGVFLALAVFLFVAPLLAAHGVMRVHRESVAQAVNERFESRFSDLTGALQPGASTSLEPDDIQELEALHHLREHVEQIPVWPVDMESITKLVAVGIGPTIVAAVRLYT